VVAAVGAPGAGAVAGKVAPRASGFGSNWTVYHGNYLSTGVDPAGTDLRPMHLGWASKTLDGPLFTSPLVYGGRVVIATENDSIYELSAHNGGVIWSRHYASPVPDADVCGQDISPAIGITGTPVIDPVRKEIFAVADELASNGAITHHLLGIDLYTGNLELNQLADPPGIQPVNQLQRPGLTLDDGQVIISYGGNDGDCNYYHGWVVAIPETGGSMRTFEVDPLSGDDQGAIWMGGGDPVVDSKGNIWVSSGNGSQNDCSQTYDLSDSVIELSPALKLEQIFAPSDWCDENSADLDLGSAAPAIVDGYVFEVGKDHIAYLMDENHLGGVGGQIEKMSLCQQDPHGGIAVDGDVVYVACDEGVAAVRITTTSPHMHTLWTTGTGANGPPIVADGLIWSVDQNGELWGLDPSNGDAVVSETTNGGEQNHFPTLAVADGLMLVPTEDQVFAYAGPAGLPPPPSGPVGATRYWVATAAGGVYPFGGAAALGSLAGKPLTKPIVGMAVMPGGAGYWLVASDGGVFSFGTARFHGSMGGKHLNRPIVGIAATADGAGYWLVASDGGIFTFGDAKYAGSMGGTPLTKPVVGMAAQPGGPGYWLVASDGGIFAFGGAHFDGSTGGIHLTTSIAGMAANPAHGGGYWLVGADGGVFSFGAPFRGSLGGTPTPAPVVGIASTPDGQGYWMVDQQGSVSAFGDALPEGGPPPGAAPVVAVGAPS
jgi:outer membrane protein assembly factor BamB